MKKRILKLLILACCLAWAGSAAAAGFEQVAKEVKEDLAEAKQEAQATRQELAAELADLKKQVATVSAGLKQENALLAAGQDRLVKLSQEEIDLKRRLEGNQTEMEEMAGLVRGAARDLLALAERSPITAEKPGRLDLLRSYMDKSRFPGLDDLQRLVRQYLDEVSASGAISRRQGQFVDREGRDQQGELVRLGAFNTLYRIGEEMGFAQLGPGTGRLLAVGGNLPWWVESNLEDYLSGQTQAVYMDMSRGGALSRLTQSSSLWEQVLTGGPLVWPIMAVGLVALILIIERLIFLGRVHANTDKLMDSVNRRVAKGDFESAWEAAESQRGRPTSNVLQAGLSQKGCQAEAIKSSLAEAMLKEMPRLERFLSTLKVLAAVAPLLGLLGTVSGMINTFHVITAHGTGDPRLMAGGISEALITTELGLAVAIPILIFSSLLGRRAQHVVSDMEEKAVALTAALIKAGGTA